jgi:hypothetical protein
VEESSWSSGRGKRAERAERDSEGSRSRLVWLVVSRVVKGKEERKGFADGLLPSKKRDRITSFSVS